MLAEGGWLDTGFRGGHLPIIIKPSRIMGVERKKGWPSCWDGLPIVGGPSALTATKSAMNTCGDVLWGGSPLDR